MYKAADVAFNRFTNEIWFSTFELKFSQNSIIRVKNNYFDIIYGDYVGLNFDFLNSMLLDNSGNLWVTTYNDFGIYDGSTWKIINQKDIGTTNYLLSSLKDKNGNIWVYIKNEGFKIHIEKEDKWYNLNELTENMPVFDFKSLLLDGNNDIIIVTKNSGIFKVKV